MNPGSEQAPLRLQPLWSRQLLISWSLVHGGALAVLALLPGNWVLRVGLLMLVLIHAFSSLQTHLRRQMPWSIVAASSTSRGWELVLANGEIVGARLLASSYVGPRLVLLNFAIGRWRRRSLPLATDSLDADLLRRLRVKLRFEAANAHDVAPSPRMDGV